MNTNMPDRNLAGAERQYLAALAQGRFNIQQCTSCTRHVFHPREICPHCGGNSLTWTTPSGRGTVYSHTTVRRKKESGGDYNVSLIDLEEGVRMMACVVDCAPEEVTVGMSVTSRIIDRDGEKIVAFMGVPA